MFALPWAGAAVWVPHTDGSFHEAKCDGCEKGLLVCEKPWPSMARTYWGNGEALNTAAWCGDFDHFKKNYYSSFINTDGTERLALNLGDLAQVSSEY